MKVVKVYGSLKKRLGQGTFEFDVATPAQAIKALCANFEGLEKWFIDNDQDGLGYRVLIGKQDIGEDNIEELCYPWSEKEVFSITPIVAGSGGFGRFVAGALLITVGMFLAPASAGFALFSKAGWAAAGFWAKTSALMGASLMLGGVSQMLSPQPQRPTEATKLKSFGFSGVGNIVGQGASIPICYGRLFVGSTAISAGLDTDQVAL